MTKKAKYLQVGDVVKVQELGVITGRQPGGPGALVIMKLMGNLVGVDGDTEFEVFPAELPTRDE